ncbi:MULTISPECIES: SLATT domain-containing protein [unclassified Psychrobacter]|uniref:SLATT domain-containing protein n=1 Tax=unclassified Psychrobacter TaxID=196806 RepID=UPI0025B3A865|nr:MULTISPECIES: SLATT domain-containing protein [unclassified Psychrobacter]MDN3452005.1 SLATT domain-containing protein [Psychrobacter sp. APC 3350]MDN3501717.1 SLATT domain-containing protein [Psychrobacter sp. 5A.1]
MKKEDSFDNLYKKIDSTSKTRFNASECLRSHSKWSTYTVVIISLVLILISLMQAYGLGKNINNDLVTLIQIFSTIAVLVYSLLIDRNDYSNLAEKMYSCATQLGELKQKIYPYLNQPHDQYAYDLFRDSYYSILKLFETHSKNYSSSDHIRAQLVMPENYNINGLKWWFSKFNIYSTLLLEFLSYILVIATLVLVLYWVWFGWSFP